MDRLRASSRLVLGPVAHRSMALPSPDPTEGEEEELPRLPRGAVERDYDLAVEEDYEAWNFKRGWFIIKGRRAAAEEVAAEKRRYHEEAWNDDPLSELSSSDESSSDSEGEEVVRKPKAYRKPRAPPRPKWADYPTPPPSNDGDYDAPPPVKRLKVDLKEFLSEGLYAGLADSASSVLPLPVKYGSEIVEAEQEFRLPYDIVYDYRLAGDGRKRFFERQGRDMRPAPFMRIDKNFFPERHKLPADPKAICMCKEGDACGKDCINRLMFYLCSPLLCPAGTSCTNQPFGYRQPKAVIPFWTGHRGFGLKTLVDIAEGDFIMEYCGEVISRDESYRRVLELYQGKRDYYFLDYDGGECLDAGQKGNYARFANHSCSPNVVVTRWKYADLDEYAIGLFARVDIAAGSELTYDYGFLAFSSLNPPSPKRRKAGSEPSEREQAKVRCMCGADECCGWLGAKRKTREEVAVELKTAVRVAAKAAQK